MLAPALKPPADGAASAYPPGRFDAIVLVSFGGPEGMDDVMPFLENVTRGRGIPRERLLEVAHHYELYRGVSPINAQNRALIDALRAELDAHGIALPIYFGNRNWHPFLVDTLRQMRDDGVERALALFTSGFACYSGCRQYREDVFQAQQAVGPDAPEVLRARMFYNHPGFVDAVAEIVREAVQRLPDGEREGALLLFTAHSIPLGMAEAADYEQQLREAARLVAERCGYGEGRWELVYQSRSGSPHSPWLEPDVCDRLRELKQAGERTVVVQPLGFVSDHMEVLFDLDEEARQIAAEIGLGFVRAPSVGTHPLFVAALRELVQERLAGGEACGAERRAVGSFGPHHDVCPPDCCRPGNGRPSPWEPGFAEWRPAGRPAA